MKQTANARLFIMIGALYFSQGIPLGVAMEALPTLLRRDGAPLHALAWLPLVGLPWVLKFLWAPLVDNRYRPARGRRRSWIPVSYTHLDVYKRQHLAPGPAGR